MVRWMCNIRLKDRISIQELRTRLKLKTTREFLQDRRLQWFGLSERMEESAWSSKCRIFKISCSFLRRRPKETWNDVIRSGLKEKKVGKYVAKDRNAWKFFHKKPSNPCIAWKVDVKPNMMTMMCWRVVHIHK